MIGHLFRHTTAVPCVLSLLEAVVKVEELDLPLKNNQALVSSRPGYLSVILWKVVKFLMEHRDEIIAPALIDDEGDPVLNQQRLDLLRNSFAVR